MTAAERRSVVLEAAERLFADRGFAATTLDDVAAAAGVTKPVVYRHFASKRDLAMFLLELHRDRLAAAPLDAMLAAPERAFPERLDAMLDAWFAYVEAHPFVRLLLQDEGSDPVISALVTELHGRQRAADIALLREFAPHVPEAEHEALGELIRVSLSGLGLWVLDRDPADADPADAGAAKAALRRTFLALVAEGGRSGDRRDDITSEGSPTTT
jgi:AcrR family transcriptional regulator